MNHPYAAPRELEWVIDLSTDKRSGLTNDPNRPDDPESIVRLSANVSYVGPVPSPGEFFNGSSRR
jgi:hypothetical protein